MPNELFVWMWGLLLVNAIIVLRFAWEKDEAFLGVFWAFVNATTLFGCLSAFFKTVLPQ